MYGEYSDELNVLVSHLQPGRSASRLGVDHMEEGEWIPGGYIMLARKLQDSSVWGQPARYLRLWVYLLLNARWDEAPTRRGSVEIGRGQVLKSFRKIRDENTWEENQAIRQWSLSTIKAMLDWFEAEDMIRTCRTDLGTLITIENFPEYQDIRRYEGDTMERGSEHLPNNRKKEERTTTTTHVEMLWRVWLEELGGNGRQPSLTPKRCKKLQALYEEQLAAEEDPVGFFRRICQALKASDHHMSERAYQMPESFLRNPERRDRWSEKATRGTRDGDGYERL